jgi:catalase
MAGSTILLRVEAEIGARLVAALDQYMAARPGHRAAHARGICCDAIFPPAAEAAALTAAPHLRERAVPAIVRFSNSSTRPDAPDYSIEVAGMAVKFLLQDGRETDIVANSLPVFFVRRPEDFVELTRARRPDPKTGRPSTLRVLGYAVRHPESLRAILYSGRHLNRVPASWLQTRYNGLHAFRWIDAAGRATNVRYRFLPELGEREIARKDARALSRDFLHSDLERRLAEGPAGFRLLVQVAAGGDRTHDATRPWPESRRLVEAGRLELRSLSADQDAGCERRVFDPTRVVEGIELSDDPLLEARRAAYSVSIERRLG